MAQAAGASQTDLQLVEQAKSGDVEAFGVLYERHNNRVLGICFNITRDSAASEDLAQDTWVSVRKNLRQFRGESAFGTWLHSVTRNLVLMHRRNMSTLFHASCLPLDEPIPPAKGMNKDGVCHEVPTEDARLLYVPDRILLQGAFATTPNDFQTAFTLKEVFGYEHKEIARILGTSIPSSKTRLRRAKFFLQEKLQGSYPERVQRRAVSQA